MNAPVPSFRRAPLLSTLTYEKQLEIERASEEKTFKRRQIIFNADQQNEHVFVLLSGRVKLFRTSRVGRELTLEIINPMDLFGEAGLLCSGMDYGATAEVLEDAVVSVMRRVDVASAIRDDCDALKEYVSLQERHRLAAEDRLAEHVFYDVPTRIARLLCRLAETHGRNSKGGAMIRLKLTHQEIANLVGSTRETTTLILNDFKRRGLVEFSGRRIIVCDHDELTANG